MGHNESLNFSVRKQVIVDELRYAYLAQTCIREGNTNSLHFVSNKHPN